MINVDSIENGTVIDHINAGKGMRVLEILKIDENFRQRIAVVVNVPSKKLGRKDIVKIEGLNVSQDQANLVALVAPNSTINIVKDSHILNKLNVSPPKSLTGISGCPNPNCITNFEFVERVFRRIEDDLYRCSYCERSFKTEELIENARV